MLRRAIDQLHTAHQLDGRWRSEPIIVLLVTAVTLAVLNYLSTAPVLESLVGRDETLIAPVWTSAFWVGCRVLCYFIIPAATLLALARGPQDFGLGAADLRPHLAVYVVLWLVMMPVVVALSFTVQFQKYYPFYSYAGESLSGLLWWEGLYAVQFVALEFFYRGFLLFSLHRYLGVYAVFVSMIPYSMIHFGKPFVETLAAIPAGVVLGALALRTRSIWPGAALHITVAWSMDLASLWQQGTLARLWAAV
jgi:membrane protease YdiL (CAAX protease family)